MQRKINSIRVKCPLGPCGEGAKCPHVGQVALATDHVAALRVQTAGPGAPIEGHADGSLGDASENGARARNGPQSPMASGEGWREWQNDARTVGQT